MFTLRHNLTSADMGVTTNTMQFQIEMLMREEGTVVSTIKQKLLNSKNILEKYIQGMFLKCYCADVQANGLPSIHTPQQ